jgi:hypothetical protein
MFVVDTMLALAILFVLILPIADRRTARMKLYVLFALLSVFTVSVTGPRMPEVQVAAIVSSR